MVALPYLLLFSNSFLRIASVEYLIGERYWSQLNHTYTSSKFTKYPPKRINGSISNDVNAVAADELVTAQPIKNPNEVAQNTSKIRINQNIKNLSASAVNPIAKYVIKENKNGMIDWNGSSVIDFEVKYDHIPYILLAYSLRNTGLSIRNVNSTEKRAVMT